MMKRKFFQQLRTSGVLWGLIFAFAAAGYAEDAPQPVRNAAATGFRYWLRRIPVHALHQFNFADGAEIDQAYPGDPFRVYLLPPEAIVNYRQETPVESLLTSTGIWYVPVLINDEMRTLLTVEFVEERWQVVGIGLPRLATLWQAVHTVRPPRNGYDHRFVSILHTQTDYVLSIRPEQMSLRPLLVAGNASSPDEDEAYAAANVLLNLRNAMYETSPSK